MSAASQFFSDSVLRERFIYVILNVCVILRWILELLMVILWIWRALVWRLEIGLHVVSAAMMVVGRPVVFVLGIILVYILDLVLRHVLVRSRAHVLLHVADRMSSQFWLMQVCLTFLALPLVKCVSG